MTFMFTCTLGVVSDDVISFMSLVFGLFPLNYKLVLLRELEAHSHSQHPIKAEHLTWLLSACTRTR